MATTPTNKPIPSEDVRDFKFNAGKIDEVVNSGSPTYKDRFGNDRYTIEGIRKTLSPLGKGYTLAEANDAIASGEIINGAVFYVWSDDSFTIADEYKNVNGVATPTGKAFRDLVRVDDGDAISHVDANGYPSAFIQNGNIYAGDLEISLFNGDGIYLVDKNGYAVELQISSENPDADSWLEQQTEKSEVLARQSREAVASRGNNAIRPLAQIVHDIYYGQSLQNGTEGWPRLSTVQPLDNLMFGDSVMPASPTAAVFTPRNGAALKPLIATCCDANGNALTDSQVAALAPGTIAYGETPVEGV